MTVSVSRVALLGAACRLPSAGSLDAFWNVLADGQCVISEVQADRFGANRFLHPSRTAPGRSVTFAAGQLERPFDFDPGYFGISPREAAVMDPQQRVLLEVAKEALDHAGIPAADLAGEHVGVYVGASSLDYSNDAQLDPALIEPQSMTGNTLSIIANRLSYIFDLRGPSYVLDTACSSSLLALHNALEDIRVGRVDTAIVGGVSMLFNPLPFIGFSRATMLSENGLCRAFDAGADGYVRSEGAVVLVLQSEEKARRDGNPIRAKFLASGTNADGRTAGLSMPSSDMQAALLHDIYINGGIDPNALAFVEAHGTGTPVGDPLEAHAIGTVLAQRRSAPLPIGSSKTNFGHLEPASGLVGTLKAHLALSHDLLPRSLHFETPNPNIRFDELNLTVASEAVSLEPYSGKERIAGVNSFGFGGTNTHIVVADGEPDHAAAQCPSDAPIVLTAASADALRELAARVEERIEAGGEPAQIANALAYKRDRLAHRAVISRAGDVVAALHALHQGEPHEGAITGEAPLPRAPVAFAYSGNGSQWAGMGRHAYQRDEAFRVSFDATDKTFMSVAGWSLVTTLFSSELEAEIERTEVAQPLLFALQVALTDALAAEGLKPAAVMGHSVGEVAAAWACGALSRADAVRVIHARSTHQEMTRHLGGMAALLRSPEEARQAIEGFAGVELAAENSPRSVTLSGPSEALADFAKVARKNRWAMKRLPLDYPFHCALVDPIHEPLLESLRDIAPQPATIAMISTVTGEPIEGQDLGPDYWWDNVRNPVLFARAVERVAADHPVIIEIGPRPVLTTYISDVARSAGVRAAALPSLAQTDAGESPVKETVYRALAHGGAVDETAVFGRAAASPDVLPAYPWQHLTYRLEGSAEAIHMRAGAVHPLLGTQARREQNEWRSTHDAVRLPFLADHKVESSTVFPATGYIEMMLAAGRAVYPAGPLELRDLDIIAPLILSDDGEREVRTREISPATFVIESRPRLRDEGWMLHAKGTVSAAPREPRAESAPDLSAAAREVACAELYELTERFGLNYGEAFRRAETVVLGDGSHAIVKLREPRDDVAAFRFFLDPTLFDSAFHGLFAFLMGQKLSAGSTVLPIRVNDLRLAEDAAHPAVAELSVRRPTDDVVEADFVLREDNGDVVATAQRVRFVAVQLTRLAKTPIINTVPLLKQISRENTASTIKVTLPETLTDHAAVEPSEGQLIVEAGVQAAATEALTPLFSEPTRLETLVREQRLARSAVPLAVRLLLGLESSGRAENCDGTWVLTGEPLALSDVVTLLVTQYQDRLAEATALAALGQRLETAFSAGLPDTGSVASETLQQNLLNDAPIAASLFDELHEVVAGVLAQPGNDAVRLLLVGAHNIGFVRKLAGLIDPQKFRLVVTDRDDAIVERATLILPSIPGVGIARFEDLSDTEHDFDLVILCPSLRPIEAADLGTLMKPRASVIGSAFAPTLFVDAVFGQVADWWVGSLEPEMPVGRLATVSEWSEALTAAGLEVGHVGPLASADGDGLIFHATKPPASAEAESAAEWSGELIATGGVARKTMDALAALMEPRNEVVTLDSSPAGDCVIALAPAQEDLANTLADLSRLLSEFGEKERRVWLITFGAHGTGQSAPDLVARAIAGAARVAVNEYPHISIRLVDLGLDFEPSVAAVRLLWELAQPNAEREIVLSSDRRAAVRYLPAPDTDRAAANDMKRLEIPQRGSIDNLVWQPDRMRDPGPGEVRIRVDATGLNFRDVMWTLGLLPHEALQDGFAGPTLGMECAGTVDVVGEGVTSVKPGDNVIAFAPSCFATHVTVRSEVVVARPDELHALAAATIPVTFLTAYYALIELADLEEGESILIHGGAGGVGLAALQLAKWRGARVFVTGGNLEKRALLTELGADGVFDSRALTFADDVMAATDGAGVDVVLNSLAGDAMERSLAVLKPFGRFLELGKRDFYENTKLGLRPFRQNLSYFGIDADQLMKYRAKKAERILTTLMDLLADGTLTPLPYRAFDADGVGDAFRLMQTAGHIGKIVVRPPAAPRPQPALEGWSADPEKAYILVGGTSGFGFATAEWLVREGAQHLVLVSRSGIKDEALAARCDELRADGISVAVRALDATDPEAVSGLIAEVAQERPVGGVFHMAMVLDDGLMSGLDAARFETVLRPKARGLDALEAALEGVPHDLFVTYSSITVQLGNPGQSNYVAANAYLEAAMERRRAAGKPGLAVAWGAISDVGVLARDGKTSELLQQKLGRHAVTAEEALATLGGLLKAGAHRHGPAVRMVGRIDWRAARKDLRLVSGPSFEDIALTTDGDGDASEAIDLAKRLAGLSNADAVSEVVGLLKAEISRILKMPANEVDAHKPLTALGMDSLMGVELRMAAEQRLGIDIPLMSLASGATLADLARKVVANLSGERPDTDEDLAEIALQHGADTAKTHADLDELQNVIREKASDKRTLLS